MSLKYVYVHKSSGRTRQDGKTQQRSHWSPPEEVPPGSWGGPRCLVTAPSPILCKSLKTAARSGPHPKPHASLFGHESKDEHRNGCYVICRAQCKMKTWAPCQEFKDGNCKDWIDQQRSTARLDRKQNSDPHSLQQTAQETKSLSTITSPGNQPTLYKLILVESQTSIQTIQTIISVTTGPKEPELDQ